MQLQGAELDAKVKSQVIKLLTVPYSHRCDSPKIFAIDSIDVFNIVADFEKSYLDRGRAPTFVRCDTLLEPSANSRADGRGDCDDYR